MYYIYTDVLAVSKQKVAIIKGAISDLSPGFELTLKVL